MQTEHSYTRRLSLIPAALALIVACGGDANEQGAATTDTLGATASGDVGAASAVNPAEAVAFMTAVDSNEIQTSQIATNKATNAEVRQFAQMMISDHSRSVREVGQLAQSMSASPSASGQQTGSMVTNVKTMGQQTLQQLNSTPKGAEFDRVYMDSQVQAHQAALANLQRIANPTGGTATGAGGVGTGATGTTGTTGTAGATSGARPQTAHTDSAGHGMGTVTSPQQAAQKMIPVVQQHLDRARQIQSRLAGSR